MNSIKKKIENIWYYYKIPIIVVLSILIVFIDLKITDKPEQKFDYSIAFISQTFPSEKEMEDIRKIFETKYNGSFDIRTYNIALTKTGQDEVTLAQLDVDLRYKESTFIIMEDLYAFKKATNNMELSSVALIKDIDWLKGHGIDNLYFATRK